MKKKKNFKNPPIKENKFLIIFKSSFWFLVGAFLGLFFLISFSFIFFQNNYSNKVYPGVMIGEVDFGGKTENEVKNYFAQKNEKISNTNIVFSLNQESATISAKKLKMGYDEDLLANQAFSIGRSNNIFSNISLIFQSYVSGIVLTTSYHYSDTELMNSLSPMINRFTIQPIDALFTFKNGKVTAFRPSTDGQEIDIKTLKSELENKIQRITQSEKTQTIVIPIHVNTVHPKITTDKVNGLGIKEPIGIGTSLFQHSIANRIFNITLASTRLNGVLIAPDEVFSFNKAVGDVSALTGYQQAYVIQNGRTVLGDGGGVCQVSTTLFRAALNAGLPIVERHAHAYRVGYYEQDSGPGLDATVYGPTVDLRFKNDTGHYILIQTSIDPNYEQLTFALYGTKDGREVKMTKPVITSQTPPLPPVYQDDPTLQKGVINQVDFEAWGASVYFTREVRKNGKTVISEKFVSDYQPWKAIFLKGTKE